MSDKESEITELVKVMHYVATNDDVTSTEVAEEFDRHYQSGSKALRKLWQAGLLTRSRDGSQGNKPYRYNLKDT